MKSNSFMRESHKEQEEFATDKRGFSRIRNNRFRSVYIRVHPWLILIFSLCLCVSVASFQRLRRIDSRPASIVSIGVEKEKRT
jgi:hypothetical protein